MSLNAACTTWGYELECTLCGATCWSFTWDGAAWSFAEHVRLHHDENTTSPTPKAYKLIRTEDQ